MPKTRKGGSSSTPTSSKLEELGELFAATAALADEEEECSTQDEPYYAGGFGTRRGTVCHCSRCLRRSGPLTDDPGQVVEDIIAFLEEVDPDGAFTGTSAGDMDEHHRVLAETTSLAVERGDADVLRKILSNISDRAIQSELATRLAIPAAQHGHVQQILLLDEFDADFEEPDPARGGPPLMHAANNGHVGAVNALLECGADTEAADYQSQTALMVAVFSDRASAAETLLSRGANVHAVDYKGRTALSHAARYGSLDCISVLAQYNADVFHNDRDGRTPIMIADECSRFEAAAQLKRLQQRQRLRERKESRQKEAGPERKFDRLELMQKEAEALRHALALVEEEEVEAQKRAARKQKAKKAKKKALPATQKINRHSLCSSKDACEPPAFSLEGPTETPQSLVCSAGKANGTDPAHEDQSLAGKKQAVNGDPSADNSEGRNESVAASDAERDNSCDEATEPNGVGDGGKAAARQSAKEVEAAGLKQVLHFRSEGGSAKMEPPQPPDPVAQLRQSWDALLKEAAGCKDEMRQASLLEEVKAMAEQCAAASISVKYGKKVLGKLEKVAPVRLSLQQLLREERDASASTEAFEAALEQARGLRSLLDEQLLAKAEDRLQQLSLEREKAARLREEQRVASASMSRPSSIRKPLESSESPKNGAVKATPEPSRVPSQRLAATHTRGQAVIPLNANASTKLPSSSILHSLGASQEMWSGRTAATAAAVQRPVAHAEGRSTIPGSRPSPSPTRLSIQTGTGLGTGSDGGAGSLLPGMSGHSLGALRQLPKAGCEHLVGPVLPKSTSAAAALEAGQRLLPSGPQMHDQGLANIWQRTPVRKDHEQPLAPTSGFFTGSLFDAPLPIQSQAAPARVQQPSLFSSDLQRSWSPMPPTSAGNGAKQDWLGDLFGGAAASSSCDSRAAQKPEEQRMDIWTREYRGLQSPDMVAQHGLNRDLGQVPKAVGSHHEKWGTNHTSRAANIPYANGIATSMSSTGPRMSAKPRWEGLGGCQAGGNAEECIVCMAAKQSCTCMPCGHKAMCAACSSAVKEQSGLCPICRRGIQQLLLA